MPQTAPDEGIQLKSLEAAPGRRPLSGEEVLQAPNAAEVVNALGTVMQVEKGMESRYILVLRVVEVYSISERWLFFLFGRGGRGTQK